MDKDYENKKILIIDDDEDLSMITSDMLSDYGFKTDTVKSCEEAYEILKTNTYSLIILDINLPDGIGFEVCKELRRVSTIPIIFCSARTSEDDKITGLDIGGDDYLAKPYSLRELLSHIKSLLRRSYGFNSDNKKIEIGNGKDNFISIESSNRVVKRNGKTINLSLKEYDLLLYMASNLNVALKKETLLNEVWGALSEVDMSTLTVHIRWLREKLENNPSKPEIIKTVWGIGYILDCGGSDGDNK